MTNYEKALELVKKGIVKKYSTFHGIEYIFIDLGGRWGGYILPKDKYVEITIDNLHVGQGDIDLDKMMVLDVSHRPDYDRHIVKSKGWYNREQKQGTETTVPYIFYI